MLKGGLLLKYYPMLQVEPIVLKRYGREAYRMFRLLSKASRLFLTDEVSSFDQMYLHIHTSILKCLLLLILFLIVSWKAPFVVLEKWLTSIVSMKIILVCGKLMSYPQTSLSVDFTYFNAVGFRRHICWKERCSQDSTWTLEGWLCGDEGNVVHFFLYYLVFGLIFAKTTCMYFLF